MKGRFQITVLKEGKQLSSGPWVSNKIHGDFSLLLAQLLHDLMGKADKVSRLASHGFFMAVGPGGARENGLETFKKEIENMEKLSASTQREGVQISKNIFQGREEVLYTVDNRKYYALQLETRDIQLKEHQLFIEASLAPNNPKTNGLRIGEFGIFTRYPSSSENIYLLNYGHHSEIRKDDELTLSRKIEFIF